MSPVLEPMSFDELSELYRVEMKSSSITQVRKDLFRSMADLLTRLRQDYDKQMSIDPESVMCEGANQRRKKAERLCKDIVHIRTQKISQMAIRGALGADNQVDMLTDEEREYYTSVLDLSRRHMSEIDRLRGRRNTVDTHIDEPLRPHVREEPTEPVPETVEEPVRDIPDPPADDEPPAPDFDDFPPEESFDDIMEEPSTDPVEEPMVPVRTEPVDDPGTESDELESVVIRIMEDLPPFVGPDRDYDLRKEDLVTMPRIMADALVNANKAAVIRPTP